MKLVAISRCSGPAAMLASYAVASVSMPSKTRNDANARATRGEAGSAVTVEGACGGCIAGSRDLP